MDYHDEYGHICRTCNGRKVIPGQHITREICPNCNGSGEIDWVCHAMGAKGRNPHPDHQIMYNIGQRNIQDLIAEIKRQGQMFGAMIDVHIEFRPEPSFQELYLTNPRPMIFPKDTKIPEF